MSPVAGRSARAASRSPPGPTTSPPCARWGRRMCSRRSPTRRRCSTRSSLDRFHPPGGARRRGAAGRHGAAPMNVPLKIPMPLRAPELAPSLGRLLVPRRPEPPWVPLDDVREELATRVLELAGEARAAAVREERERVLDAVSRRAWLTAWEHAVRRAAQRVAGALDAEIERAALRVRMPRHRRRGRLLSGSEKRAIAARLSSGGEGFVAALDALDTAATRVRDASVLDRAALGDWQEAIRTAARRLEAAWLALEAEVAAERRRWDGEIEAVARWRLPLWPLLALWTPLAAALVWLGLVLGGDLRRQGGARVRAPADPGRARVLREPARPRDARRGAPRRQGGGLQGVARQRRGPGDRVARDRGHAGSRRPA